MYVSVISLNDDKNIIDKIKFSKDFYLYILKQL